MKQHLVLNGTPTNFRNPHYLYDIISVYDKSLGCYVPKKRSTAITISDTEEILICMLICSSKDTFSKKKARAILDNRIEGAIQSYTEMAEKHPTYMASPVNGTYLFTDYETFAQFCNVMDASAQQFFTPYKLAYSDRVSNTVVDINLTRPSSYYFHKQYVRGLYNKLAEHLTGTPYLDTSFSEERNSNSPVSAGKS